MKLFFALIALLSGAGLALQVGFNSQLRVRMGHPIPAALTSFLIGTTCLLTFVAAMRPPLPETEALQRSPWWIWMGGVVGACYVASAAAFARHLGAAGWLGLIVTGQILTSLMLDHFGLVGFPTHPISVWRIVGAALLLAGVVIVLRT